MANQVKNLQIRRNSYKKTTNNSESNDTSILHLIPIIFVIAFLPHIVKIYDYITPLSQYEWFSENNHYFDFFLHYKQVLFITASIIMLLFILYLFLTEKKKITFPKIFIPLALYAFLTLLSSIISEYRSYAFSGTFEQLESVLVLLGYCISVYYAYLFVHNERDLKYIILSLLISVIIFGFLGLSQVTGNDFYNTTAGWNLISNLEYRDYKDNFDFVAGINRVYLSFYNPNYVGSYVSLVLPVLLFAVIFAKKIWHKVVFFLGCIALSICLYGSLSTSGFISVSVSILLLLVLIRKHLIKYFYITIPAILIVIISIFMINIKLDNYFIKQVSKITNIQKSAPLLTEIQTNDKDIVIKYNNNTLKVTFSVDQAGICLFIFTDENDDIIPYQMTSVNGSSIIMDERFSGLTFTPVMFKDIICFETNISGNTWTFSNQVNDKTYYFKNPYGRFVKLVNTPSAILTGYEHYASGRGYIWSRTIPLLKDKILLGSGADTYILEFPQLDYINKFNYGFYDQVMSKPHNLYLQMAMNTGVLSLIAFLVFYGIYFISSFRLYFTTHFDNPYSITGASIFIGSFGYMISGLSNDSSITIAPVFWSLIGVGIAINKIVKSKFNDISINH